MLSQQIKPYVLCKGVTPQDCRRTYVCYSSRRSSVQIYIENTKQNYEKEKKMVRQLFKRLTRVKEKLSREKISNLTIEVRGSEEYISWSLEGIMLAIGKKYKDLKALTFKFNYDQLTRGLLDTINNLSSFQLEKLERFSVTLSKFDLKLMCDFVSKFNTIKSLCINLNADDRIGSYDFESLVREGFQQMGLSLQHIQNLSISFANLTRVTDYVIQNLFVQFKSNWRHLRKLCLNFDTCRQITSYTVKALTRQILSSDSCLKNIHNLSLSFSQCDQINDEAVEQLCQSISLNMKALKSLSLNFCYCYDISEEIVLSLSRDIQVNAKNLVRIKLHFSIGKTTKEYLKELFKAISHVEIQ